MERSGLRGHYEKKHGMAGDLSGSFDASAGSGMRVASASPNVPNFSNLKKTAIAAHYPSRVLQFDDRDGNALYLNVVR
jgi:hypothetical protein